MPLRLRLMASIAAALVLSLALGAGLACWRAARSVRSELSAALTVGEQALRSGVADLAQAAEPGAEPARLLASFDGGRHVAARLLGASGDAVAVSRTLAPDSPAPGWFVWLVAPAAAARTVGLPPEAGGGAIVLQAAPANEAAEVWAALGDSAAEMLVFSVMASGLTMAVAAHAMRPLAPLAAALDQLGPGQYGVRVAQVGPPDISRLAAGFNRMGERLAAVERQNQRLAEQVLTIQDEERADLARDLHDEVGPFLFSISVGAAAVERLLAAGDEAGIRQQLGLIREDVGHAQHHVRAILARLRPVTPAAFGLDAALGELVRFWAARSPAVAFDLSLAPGLEMAGEPVQDAAYRVVQEAVSNAIRHGRPRHIGIAVACGSGGLTVRVSDDGCGAPPAAEGFGIEGMRQRVAALGGRLHAGPACSGGWLVSAALPAAPGPWPSPSCPP